MKAPLICATLMLAACAGAIRPLATAPAATAKPAAAPAASELPPLVLPADSDDGAGAGARANAVQVAEVPVTVLPTIIGHRSIPGNSSVRPAGGLARDDNDQTVRIALALGRVSVRLYATGGWSIYDGTSRALLARVGASDTVTVDTRDGSMVATGIPMGPVRGPMIARPSDGDALIVFDGHRYRGEIAIARAGEALSVINRIGVESYLRGVVPLEIGTDRTIAESAAVEAQAIAARNYSYTHMDDTRPYDMLATTADQVYGGADAERPLSDAAVRATRNMVMMYGGKVINAPYHSNSGGVTASASEVWRSGDEPYLVSVSDRIPGTDHFYGEESPRFHWTRTLDEASLSTLLDRYLPQYSSAPRGGVGRLQKIEESGRTPSGRVAGLIFTTDRGSFPVRGNDARLILRSTAGELLPSTLFTIEQSKGSDGHVTQITIRGSGNGHGVGMDQWGAISRARAGQDALTILRAYYPGTTIGRVI
ncbi:MAG: SpoIID/LytB domain-containing protein [Gemmatimonadota bacterium]|nr:SpoIID/LytB domain-containing protein [Gemmatimonadota bacterium]